MLINDNQVSNYTDFGNKDSLFGSNSFLETNSNNNDNFLSTLSTNNNLTNSRSSNFQNNSKTENLNFQSRYPEHSTQEVKCNKNI